MPSPPDLPEPYGGWPPVAEQVVPVETRYTTTSGRPPQRKWLHWTLFAATFATTWYVGVAHYLSFLWDFAPRPLLFTSQAEIILGGLWYAVPVLAILGAHELGHYYACRYHHIDATWPFFIPFPLGLSGTLGAVIRIRDPIRTKRALFDMAVAGPIAGFVALVPFLIWGLALSRVAKLPADLSGGGWLEIGEPLLLKAVTYVIHGQVASGFAVNWHPMVWSAWFGMLATAINLFPIAQLDGGHISYAVLGRKSDYISLVALASAGLLIFVSWSWVVWTALLLVMLRMFGWRHPPTFDDHLPISRGRVIVALIAVLMFIACFTPAPIQPLDLVTPR